MVVFTSKWGLNLGYIWGIVDSVWADILTNSDWLPSTWQICVYFLNIAADFHQHWTRCGGGGDHRWCLRVQLLAGQRGHDCSNSDSYVTRKLCAWRNKNRRKQTMVMCFLLCVFVLSCSCYLMWGQPAIRSLLLCFAVAPEQLVIGWMTARVYSCAITHDDVGGKRDILHFQHERFTVNGPRGKWQKP